MGGEPLVALDLSARSSSLVDPVTRLDRYRRPRSAAWWKVQARRLPPGPVPDSAAVRRLRAAVRDLLDAHLQGRAPDPTSLEDVNATAASVPTSPRLVPGKEGVGPRAERRWHTEHGGNAALAMITPARPSPCWRHPSGWTSCAGARQPRLLHAVPRREQAPQVVHRQRLRQPHPRRPPLRPHPPARRRARPVGGPRRRGRPRHPVGGQRGRASGTAAAARPGDRTGVQALRKAAPGRGRNS